MMLTCPYCDTNYERFQSKCSSCGANLPKQQSIANPAPQNPIDRNTVIRTICETYEDAREFRPLEGLPIYVLENAKYSYPFFPEKMEILLICDLDEFLYPFFLIRDL